MVERVHYEFVFTGVRVFDFPRDEFAPTEIKKIGTEVCRGCARRSDVINKDHAPRNPTIDAERKSTFHCNATPADGEAGGARSVGGGTVGGEDSKRPRDRPRKARQ